MTNEFDNNKLLTIKIFLIGFLCLVFILFFSFVVYHVTGIYESEINEITEIPMNEITESFGFPPSVSINKYDSNTYSLNIYPPNNKQRTYTIKKLKIEAVDIFLLLNQNGEVIFILK